MFEEQGAKDSVWPRAEEGEVPKVRPPTTVRLWLVAKGVKKETQ